jgi:hypothetical protein
VEPRKEERKKERKNEDNVKKLHELKDTAKLTKSTPSN